MSQCRAHEDWLCVWWVCPIARVVTSTFEVGATVVMSAARRDGAAFPSILGARGRDTLMEVMCPRTLIVHF